MHNSEFVVLVDRLRREPVETEWLEFKENRYKPQAALHRKFLLHKKDGFCTKSPRFMR